MAVSLWAVLGIVLVLLGIALSNLPQAAYGIGAGVAFLIVAFVEWVLNRNHVADDPDLVVNDT